MSHVAGRNGGLPPCVITSPLCVLWRAGLQIRVSGGPERGSAAAGAAGPRAARARAAALRGGRTARAMSHLVLALLQIAIAPVLALARFAQWTGGLLAVCGYLLFLGLGPHALVIPLEGAGAIYSKMRVPSTEVVWHTRQMQN
jgi:hypothetical protein